MKKTILIMGLIIGFACATASAAVLEYPYLYKSPRALGMGGAYVAIGGRVDTLFYNPAGLARMPEKNWEVNILHPSFEVGKNVTDFANDMMDAFDAKDADVPPDDETDEQTKAVNDVITKYLGKNLHLRISEELFSIGRNSGDKTAFGFGIYGNQRLDAKTHQGFGSEGLIEVNSEANAGGVGGMSYKIRDDIYAGAAVKYFYRASLIHNFTAREIAEKSDDLGDYILDESVKQGGAAGLDLGGLYLFAQKTWFKPIVGLSVQNIGMNYDDNDIPTVVNLGVSMNPDEIPVFKGFRAGFDIVDILGGYEQDNDIPKRIRVGGELDLFSRRLAAMTVRTGLYQGYPTFGADLRLLVLTFNYTTYAEEIGAFGGQDKDRRHLASLNIGW